MEANANQATGPAQELIGHAADLIGNRSRTPRKWRIRALPSASAESDDTPGSRQARRRRP